MTDIPKFAAHHRASDDDWQTLDGHLHGVARWARRFAAKLGLPAHGELIGLLHDLGKYSQAFQNYLKSATGHLEQDIDEEWVDADGLRGKIDHSTAGAQFLWQALSGGKANEQITAQILALCIASHHSGLINCIGADEASFGQDIFGRRMSKPEQKAHLDEVLLVADAGLIARCHEILRQQDLSTDLRTMINKIEQHNKNLPTVICCQIGLAVRVLFSCLIDADRIDTADFEHQRVENFRPGGEYVLWATLVDRLERHLQTLAPRRPIDALRNEISAHCLAAASRDGGVYTLTVPTGGGKTLASLRFALHHAAARKLDRIIYVIPFTSIIDQNAGDVRAILEPADSPQDFGQVVLEHHSSLTPEQQTWQEKILCENWDAPVVYTTMVQFLEALFGGGTRGARRMHQLANAVLVFDEIQTLPIRCVHLFNNAINFLVEQCRSTVVLCTATQPLLQSVAVEQGAIRLKPGHEIMPNVQNLFDALRRVDVRDARKPGGWSYDDIATLAIAELGRAGSCLVIANTKDAARQIFLRCQTQIDAGSIFHLSTDMCPAHRKAVLGSKHGGSDKTVIARLAAGHAVLCVSTQLIEAGVDVDFGAVIRTAAGLDSVAQAAGRCNRHGRPEPGVVHIVNPSDERLDKLPDISVGREKAQRILDDFKDDPARFDHSLIGPKALHDYYTYYFFQRQDEMAYRLIEKDVGHDDDLLNLLALNKHAVSEFGRQQGRKPDTFMRQAFMTAGRAFKAIDAPTQAVVVPFGHGGKQVINDLCAAFTRVVDVGLLRRAQQYTVNVFPHVLRKLEEAGALHPAEQGKLRVLCLDGRYYSPQFGLTTEAVYLMEPLVE